MEAVTDHPAVTTWAWHVTPEHLSINSAGDLRIDGRIFLTCSGVGPAERLVSLAALGRHITKLAVAAESQLLANEDAAS
jgi:hypothetical protein